MRAAQKDWISSSRGRARPLLVLKSNPFRKKEEEAARHRGRPRPAARSRHPRQPGAQDTEAAALASWNAAARTGAGRRQVLAGSIAMQKFRKRGGGVHGTGGGARQPCTAQQCCDSVHSLTATDNPATQRTEGPTRIPQWTTHNTRTSYTTLQSRCVTIHIARRPFFFFFFNVKRKKHLKKNHHQINKQLLKTRIIFSSGCKQEGKGSTVTRAREYNRVRFMLIGPVLSGESPKRGEEERSGNPHGAAGLKIIFCKVRERLFTKKN